MDFFGGLASLPWLIVWESAWKDVDVESLIIAVIIAFHIDIGT
jgi:hypothetical protein